MSGVVAKLVDAGGRAVRVGRSIGRGGEGAVHEVAGEPALVAKLYHTPVAGPKADKLRAMTRMAAADLLRVAAWPTQTLHEDRAAMAVCKPAGANDQP